MQNGQTILDAFARLVEQFEVAPTMSDVVRASGLGRATVYRHFPDIGSMAFAQLDEGYHQLFSEFRNSVVHLKGSEMEKSLVEFLSRYFLFSKCNRSILINPECQNSKAYSRARNTLRALVFEALSKATDEGKDAQAFKETSHIIACCAEAELWPNSTNGNSLETALSMIAKLIRS